MKKRLTSYTFDASAKTIVQADFSDITLEGIQMIINVTDNIIIYNFADPNKGGTLATDTLTLDYDTTSMSDTDELMILVEDGSDTQPISAASLPLPTGASTLAEQQTQTGHLATIAGDTTSLDGKDFATSAKQDTTNTHLSNIDAGKLEEATFTGRIGEVQASPTANTVLARLKTIADNQLADGHNVTIDNASIAITAASLPLPTGASTSANQSTIIGHVDGIETLLGTIDTDTSNISTKIDTIAGAVSGTEMQVDIVGSLPAGTNAIGKLAANSGVDIGDVTINNSTGASAVNIQDGGNSITVDNGGTFATQPTYTAATPYKLVSAATTNATSVKGSAGVVYGIYASNVNAAARYLKLYNKASAPTVGTDTPVHTFIIPGNTAGAGTNIPIPVRGINFSTGIAFALTTEATDAGTTAVAANEIVININYI